MNIIALRDIDAGEEVCTPLPDIRPVLNLLLALGIDGLHRYDSPEGAKTKDAYRNLQLYLPVPAVHANCRRHRPTGSRFVSQIVWWHLPSSK